METSVQCLEAVAHTFWSANKTKKALTALTVASHSFFSIDHLLLREQNVKSR